MQVFGLIIFENDDYWKIKSLNRSMRNNTSFSFLCVQYHYLQMSNRKKNIRIQFSLFAGIHLYV